MIDTSRFSEIMVPRGVAYRQGLGAEAGGIFLRPALSSKPEGTGIVPTPSIPPRERAVSGRHDENISGKVISPFFPPIPSRTGRGESSLCRRKKVEEKESPLFTDGSQACRKVEESNPCGK